MRFIRVSVAAFLWGASALAPLHSAFAETAVVLADQAASALPDRDKSFAQQRSDLAADPDARFGRLPNGMGYILYKNATPPKSASFRLRIDAGSILERQDQRGLAHFIEHMAFRGSTHVPENELAKILERKGLAFGVDTNAHTSYNETVFELDAPETDDDTVDTILFLLRETASEISFKPSAIDAERGAVLGEERLRDNPQSRSSETWIRFIVPGTRAAERRTIGDVGVLKTAQRPQFLDYYHDYYRPERAVLVVTGDFDLDKVEAKIKAKFADWHVDGPAPGDKPYGGPAAPGLDAKIYSEPGVNASVDISWPRPFVAHVEDKANGQKAQRQDLVLSVLNRRLSVLAQSAEAPFAGVQVGQFSFERTARIIDVSANPKNGDWKSALTALEQKTRQFVSFGVTQDELNREITEQRAGLVNAVSGAKTRDSRDLAEHFYGAVADDEVAESPAQQLADFDARTKDFTAAEANALIPELFAGAPKIFVNSPVAIPGGETALLDTFNTSVKVAVAPPVAELGKAWAYTDFGAPGVIAARDEIKDLGVTRVTFKNGVMLIVKPTKLKIDSINVIARFQGGLETVPTDKLAAARVVSTVAAGGLGKLTFPQIDKALNGKLVGISFGFGQKALTLSGSTRPSDFAAQMQVLAAYTTDAAYRDEPLIRFRSQIDDWYNSLDANPGGAFAKKGSALLYDGNPRFAFPSKDAFKAVTAADLKGLLEPELKASPLEITIVGDINVETAIAQTAATFGALPPRGAAPPVLPGADTVRFPKGDAAPVVLTHKGRPDQTLVVAAWPTTDFYANTRRARALEILSDIFSSRLLDEVRIKQGASYFADAQSEPSDTFRSYGVLTTTAGVKPEHFGDFYTAAFTIAADLRAKPVTEDELTRAKKPALEKLAQDMADNGFWLGRLSGSSFDPRQLDALRSREPQLKAVTAAEVQAVAQAYLDPAKAVRIQVEAESLAQGTK